MFSFIAARKAEHGISRMCAVLGVSESGYQAHRCRPASSKQRADAVLGVHIRAAFVRSRESYGSPRMVRELQAQGPLKVGRRRVARLMRENCLDARPRRRFVRDDRQRPCSGRSYECSGPGLHDRRSQPEVGRRYHLHLDKTGLALPGRRHRPLLPPRHRLANLGPHAERPARKSP